MPLEVAIRHKRLEHEGVVWNIDGKIRYSADGQHGVLTVYRVYGDATKPTLLKDALNLYASTLGVNVVISRAA